MKKAIQIAYNELFETKCRFAAEGGFEYISANLSEILGKTEYDWEVITEDIQRILDENNLKCVQSHPYYYDLRVSSEIMEEEYEFAIKQAIIATGKLGGGWSVIHPRSAVNAGFSTSKAFEDNRRYLSEYLELAVKHGSGIAVENLPVFHGIVPVMPFYSSNFEDLSTLVDSFHDDNMQVCWDFGHANLMHFDQAEAIKFMGNRIKCTHVHNNFCHDDDHLPPDNGNIQWDKVMSALYSTGFDGPLTLETHCRYDDLELLRSFARHNFECLRFIEQFAK